MTNEYMHTIQVARSQWCMWCMKHVSFNEAHHVYVIK